MNKMYAERKEFKKKMIECQKQREMIDAELAKRMP